MGDWKPADIIEAARLLIQFAQLAGLLIVALMVWFGSHKTNAAVEKTGAAVAAMQKDVDGRLSQVIDIIGRLAGVPNRRVEEQPVDVERRVKNKGAGNGE